MSVSRHPDFIAIPVSSTRGHAADEMIADTSTTAVSDALSTGTVNLASRQNSGTSVSLHFDRDSKEVWVAVSTPSQDFTLREIPHPLALDVYHHPFAYASRIISAGTYAAIAE